MELEPGTLDGSERLKSIESWDSLATLSFIAMADEKAGIQIPGTTVARCETVNDLVDLLSPGTASS